MLPAPTARLRFREMTDADLDDVEEMLEVSSLGSAYVGRNPASWVAWNRHSYTANGFGLWVTQTRDGAFVGNCGLTLQNVEGERLIEVGWHTLPALRGRGYASEAATAVLHCARSAGVDHVIALIRRNNLASQRVAEKTGLTLEREAQAHGGPMLVFGKHLS